MSPAALRPQLIGYWFELGAPPLLTLPRPQRLVSRRGGAAARRAIVDYLRAGRRYETYPSPSRCRFGCGVTGRLELGDGTWVWPDGLAHYVEVHAVRLPPAFLARVAAGPPTGRSRTGPDDITGWRRWAEAEGACLRLDPAWQTIADAELPALRRRLRRRSGLPLVLLAHQLDGRVLAHHGGSLCIVAGDTGRVLARAADDDERALDRLVLQG